MQHPRTPDGRYFVVRGRLWRCTNPHLSEVERQLFVDELMAARREVKRAREAADDVALKSARQSVDKAKRALGERGPTWWDDDTDFNRCMIRNTPYANWWLERSNELC
ncbi:hypothetical protein [Rosistilla oblonga]|uniref:Uncharacterized protein n=1 Tax=Rosistilla oblonga TaxID=2527990 RepID=A0A518ISL3_9BACT|nr:hypothetical protein [Rosistilla oblonga]QDV56082.1 hypothetical protein Mal33_20610 [Rosistilla oblonga]